MGRFRDNPAAARFRTTPTRSPRQPSRSSTGCTAYTTPSHRTCPPPFRAWQQAAATVAE